MGLSGAGELDLGRLGTWKSLGPVKNPKSVDRDVEIKYRIAFTFPNKLRLSANDAAREKQLKNAKLDPHSFYALMHAAKEEIRPLNSIIVTPLQGKTFPQASKLPYAFNLPTPALTEFGDSESLCLRLHLPCSLRQRPESRTW